jgi:hypothetical protein
MRIALFVFSLSTIMRIESQLLTGGKSVFRFMEQLANGCVDFASSSKHWFLLMSGFHLVVLWLQFQRDSGRRHL